MKTNLPGVPLRISLRAALVVPFVLETVAAVGLVGYLSFRNGYEAVSNLAQQLQTEVSDRIDQHLDQFLATPPKLNELNLAAVDLAILDLNDFQTTGHYFWKQMQIYNVGYINFGDTEGNFIGVERLDDGGFNIIETDADRLKPGEVCCQQFVYGTNDQGDRTELLEINPDYDHRKEAWYAAAAEGQTPVWSEIYQWEDKPEILSISSSFPVFDAQNQFIGVIGVDHILSQISQYLKGLEVAQTGLVFIWERDGSLVASSSDETPYAVVNGQPQRLKVQDSLNPLVKLTAQQMAESSGGFSGVSQAERFQVQWAGQTYFASVMPWQDDLGLNWLIAVVIPESDFTAQIQQNTRTTILLCTLALITAIILGLLTARWISQLINRMTNASEAIAAGNLNQHIQSSSIIELNQLANSFNSMAGQLKASFDTLEEKVQERTQELAHANAEISILNERLAQENLRMESELDILRQMQQMILPRPEELDIEGLDIAGFMEPADEVGGDYYDVLSVDGVVTIAMGDVTGHGLESGILMLMTQTAVRILKEIREHDPVRFLDTLNRTLYKNLQRMNSDRNLTLVVLNYAEGRISISGQHEEAIVVRRGGLIERVNTMDLGFPIGLDQDIADFINHTIVELHPGDGIVLYTDGITEARNLQKKQYGIERLCEVVSTHWEQSASSIKQRVIDDVRQHIGSQKILDDITLLVLKHQDDRPDLDVRNESIAVASTNSE